MADEHAGASAKKYWPSYDLIFFDCDSTLTRVEGIDELARLKGKGWRVSVLTDKAMDGKLDLEEVYERRLRAIYPTREQVRQIAQVYGETKVPDAQVVIEILQHFNREVFIISGGLADAVSRFGAGLGVPPDHIRAVELEYDQLAGEWWSYHDHQYSGNPDERYLNHEGGPLTVSQGKAQVVRALAGSRFGRRLLVGDGTSDMNASEAVDLFVGFGGVVRREKVARGAPVYVDSPGLTPILPIALGPAGYRRCLGTQYADPFERGLKHIMRGEVTFREPGRREAFLASFDPLPE
jgi:phosphoserine phosphatase